MLAQASRTTFIPAIGLKLGLIFGGMLGALVFGAAACGGGGSSTGDSGAAQGVATISTQPASQTAAVGQTATFTVLATGAAPLSYQWQKNGTAISGATLASYTTPALTSTDNGAKFIVVVNNAMGSATSTAATLTIGAARRRRVDRTPMS